MKRIPILAATLLSLCSLRADDPGFRVGATGLPFRFFAMDTGTRDAKHTTAESQAVMLKALGYDGMDHTGTRGIPEKLKALDAQGLDLFAIYLTVSIDGGKTEIPGIEDAIRALKDRPTIVWLAMRSSQHGNSSPAGDEEALAVVRRVADLATESGVRVAMYPHTGFWVERVEDAVRLARKAERPNVGAGFNLCHWLKVTGGRDDLVSVLAAAMPHLFVVTINGADSDGTNWTTLIQTLDRGSFDTYNLLRVLRDLGYAGPVGLQGFGIGGDVHDNLSRSVGAWRAMSARMEKEWDGLLETGLANWRDPVADWTDASSVAANPDNEKLLVWERGQGTIVNGRTGRTKNLFTKTEHGDTEAHVEFMVPKGSNSGVYFQGRYEVQVLDSWGVEEPKHGDCGGIYQRWDNKRKPPGFEGQPPRVNASRPPGEWQTFDVIFRAPEFTPDGRKTANGLFIKVWHNGVFVHENIEVTGPTRAAAFGDEKTTGPMMLQGDHGPVAYRNIRMRRLSTGTTALAARFLSHPAFDAIRAYEFGQSRLAFTELDDGLRTGSDTVRAAAGEKLIGLLQANDTTLDCKREILRLLGRWGTPDCVPGLAALLIDKELSFMARSALHARSGGDVDQAFLAALGRVPDDLKPGLIDTIGERRIEAAVPALAKSATSPSADIARASIAALGRIGTVSAADALEGLRVADTSRPTWTESCLACAASLLATVPQRAADLYGAMFADTNLAHVRAAALAGLVHADPERGTEFVLATLVDTSRAVARSPLRQAAIQLLPALPGAAAAEARARFLRQASPADQVVVLSGLTAQSHTSVTPVVAELAGSATEPAVSAAALRALALLGDASHVPLLASIAASGTPLASVAEQTLQQLTGAGVDRAIADLLRQADADVQAALVRVITSRSSEGAVTELLKLAVDTDAKVRDEALKALGKVAGADVLPGVLDLLVSASLGSPFERLADAASRIARRADPETRSKCFLAAWPRAAGPARIQLLQIIAEFGGARELGVVRAALGDDDVDARRSAVRALAQWPDTGPMDTLRELTHNTDDELSRLLALRGYIRMIAIDGRLSPSEKLVRFRDAMDKATRRDERRQILDALADVPEAGVLALIQPWLDDADLAAEAKIAYVEAARSAGLRAPSIVRDALQVRIKAAADDAFRKQLQDSLAWIEKFGGHITTWLLAGPFAGSDTFATAFPPENPDAKDVEWRNIEASVGPFTDFIKEGGVNLGTLIGGTNRVAYLRTTVECPNAVDAVLELGSDDGIKAWLNGKLVHSNNAARPVKAASDKANVSLGKGCNVLMLKVTQGGGEWGAIARFVTPEGREIPGLVFRTVK